VERLRKSLADLKAGDAGHVRIGATEPTASYRLPAILKRFTDAYPNVRVSVGIGSTQALGERILKGEIDFALSTAPGIDSSLYFESWFEEEFAVFLPETHPLAQRETIEPNDFAGSLIHMTCGMMCKESAYPFRLASQTLYTFIKQALGDRRAAIGSAR